MNLKKYFLYTKQISFYAHQIDNRLCPYISYVVGNSSCDPDSVFGSINLSVVNFIQENIKREKFDYFANHFFDTYNIEDHSQQSNNLENQKGVNLEILNEMLSLIISEEFKIYVPIINTKEISRITKELDIEFLNDTFDYGLENCADLNLLYSCKKDQMQKFCLFDHNQPENLLKSFIDSIKDPSLELVIDHHQIANSEYTKKFEKTLIKKAGSCNSLLITYTEELTMDFLLKNFPNILRLVAMVIRLDTFDFSENLRNNRWLDFDKEIYTKLINSTRFKEVDIKFKELVNLKFSDRQFENGIADLYARDSKEFDYDGKKFYYAIFMQNATKYLEKFKDEIFLEAASLASQK